MGKLTSEIKRLEQEIAQNRQLATLQFQRMKNTIADKINSTKKSPLIYTSVFAIGAMIGKRLKRRAKLRAIKTSSPREKLSFLQKMMALSSEITIAIKLFNRVKPVLAKLAQKTTNPHMTVSH